MRGMRLLVISGFLIVSGITTDFLFGLDHTIFFQNDSVLVNASAETIHTVLLHVKGNDFSVPIFSLGSDQKLELHFDDLSGNQLTCGYTLVHCDTYWKPSELSSQEFLSGYGKGVISEVESSFNTTIDYHHYRLEFPEEDCTPLISGNYVIVVYEENNPDNIILTRRFYVTEETAKTVASVRQPSAGIERETSQQVLFTVTYNTGEIRDPMKDVTAIVMQNNRYDRQVVLRKPYVFQPGRLDYNGAEMGIIPAGNEFRSLDIKSMKYQAQNIASIDFSSTYYHVLLKTDADRSGKPWFSNRDLNGSYYVDMEKADDRHTEADYVYVHFNLNLPMAYPVTHIYVAGGFNDWRHDKSSLMIPSEQNGNYTLTLLMKQGLYDYCYMQKDEETGLITETGIEGSFYETGNSYAIFIYFHDQFKRYDRLIGYTSTK
jgi:hypothetical protein